MASSGLNSVTTAEPPDRRAVFRNSLGIPSAATVAFVVWEPQTEHLWRMYWTEIAMRYHVLLVYPFGHRAQTMFRATNPVTPSNLRVVDTFDLTEIADETLTFRVLEDIARASKAPVRIIDPQNRWLSKELSASIASIAPKGA